MTQEDTKRTSSDTSFQYSAAQPFLNEAFNSPSFVDFVDLDQHDSEANLFTHTQVHDSYREGTIDAKFEVSKHGADSNPDTP
jgi:hypothetical protein